MAVVDVIPKGREIGPILADRSSFLKVIKQQGESLLYSFRSLGHCSIGLSANFDRERHRASFTILIKNDNNVKPSRDMIEDYLSSFTLHAQNGVPHQA
jgi:hypothetical protein